MGRGRTQGSGRIARAGEERGGLFAFLNLNKLSVTLNFKHHRGRELFAGLLDGADLLIENFAPGTLARLGLAPDGADREISEAVGRFDFQFRAGRSRSRRQA